jgi:hypothetical protein
MRKGLLGGMIGVLGLAAPSGLLAAGGGVASTASSVAPAVASVGGTVMPGLVHAPLLGKHVLSVSNLFGVRQTTQVQSANWAGYADINDTYQTLSSSWVQPAVDCSKTFGGFLGLFGSPTAYSSFWVGLDGYNSSSVEQTGTDSDCLSNGTASYYAWYEMYPASSVQQSTAKYPVSPNDTMTAMVMSNVGGTQFYLSLKDVNKGWSFTVPETGSGFARSSAEFVAEAPSQCSLIFCSELPLADFGSVTFTNAVSANTKGTVGNIALFPNAAMTMASNGQVLATPGPLTNTTTATNNSSSFTVTWNS